jgi:hypothetical protein
MTRPHDGTRKAGIMPKFGGCVEKRSKKSRFPAVKQPPLPLKSMIF